MKQPYRVWANFSDPQTDIAVLVDAESAEDAKRQGMEILKDEHSFGGPMNEAPKGYTVEQMF